MIKYLLILVLCAGVFSKDINGQTITCTAYAMGVTGAGQCDGLITLSAQGGTGPYTFYLDSVGGLSSLFSGVCQGLHQFYVTDGGGLSSLPQYIVLGNLQSTYVIGDTFTNLPVVDSVISNVQNCNYNYNVMADSVHFDSIEALPAPENYIAWFEIWQQGQQITFTDTLVLDSFGINQVNVIMYCDTTHRAVEGTLTIKYYINNNNHGSATAVQTLSAGVSRFQIYPNPTTDVSTAYIEATTANKFELTLTNLSGQVIQHLGNVTGTNVQLNLKNLEAGVYVVTVRSNDGVESKQLVKF